MSVEDLILNVLVLGMLAAVVLLANIADRDANRTAYRVVVGVLGLMSAVILLAYGVQQVLLVYYPSIASGDLSTPTETEAWAAFSLSLAISIASVMLLRFKVRMRLVRWFPAPTRNAVASVGPSVLSSDGFDSATPLIPSIDLDDDSEPLFPQMLNYYTTRSSVETMQAISVKKTPRSVVPISTQPIEGYDPRSAVHMVAMVFVLFLLGTQMLDFILGGGLEGLAESLSEGISVAALALNAAILIIIPLVGVGAGLRRSPKEVAHRLGLTWPRPEDFGIAILATMGLFTFLMFVTAIWVGLVSEETFREETQASDALASGVTSMWLAFLIAFTAAVSEEIAFRGALQPIFGLWPVAIVFAATHTQYALTPATLIIFVVALVFGWLRKRFNTTTAMLTHFLFNFVQLAASVALAESVLFFGPRFF